VDKREQVLDQEHEIEQEKIEEEEELEFEEELEEVEVDQELVSCLSNAVRRVINLLSSGRKVREPYTIRVTEAISCLRKSYLNIVYGACPDNLYMSIGRYMHNIVLDMFRQELAQLGEVEIEPKITTEIFTDAKSIVYKLWQLVAEPDIVVRTRNGQVHVIELKFNFGKRTGTEAIRKYMMQVGTYVKMLNADLGHIVIIKNSLDVKYLTVTRQEAEQYYRQVIERARKLAKSIIEEKIPEPEPGIDCKTCPYTTTCRHVAQVHGSSHGD